MPSRKSYNRFFIILQEDQKGYGIDTNRTPSGYAKLEMRNDRAKTSFYVQDIKKQNGPYYMVLIAQGISGNRELINLGQINIDEGGKADISSEHDANNIANTNISMDKIQGAGICRINGTKVNPVMAGFICGEELKNWATYPMSKVSVRSSNGNVAVKTEEVNIKTEAKKEIKPVEKIKADTIEVKKFNEDRKNEDIAINETKVIEKLDLRNNDEFINEVVKDSNTVEVQDFDDYEDQIERLKEYRKKQSEKKCNDDDDSDEDDDNGKDYDYKKKYDKNDYPVGPMGDFFKSVVKDMDKKGSHDSIKNCQWYKAHVENLESMYCENDYNKYSVVFYPMICYYPYIAKTKSFMIGYKCDDDGVLKYIIYAIPGTKALVDQPYEGKTGFVTFMGDKDNSETGHWLMYYDIKKSSVVVPVKKNK